MKLCKQCNETKPLNESYAHPRMADGYFNRLMSAAAYLLAHRDVLGEVSY